MNPVRNTKYNPRKSEISNRARSVEAEGKTVEEAIKIALKKLGISKEKATIKILTEEDKGLFGMRGAKPAKVRVTIRE